MKNSFGINRTLGGAIGAIAIVIVIISGILYSRLGDFAVAIESRGHSYQMLSAIDEFRQGMLNQETGLRGFLLSSNQENLAPYIQGRPQLDDALNRLRALTAGNAAQIGSLAAAEAAARNWQVNVAEPALRAAQSPATKAQGIDIERSQQGRIRFDAFRSKIDSIQDAEDARLLQQQRMVSTAEQQSIDALIVGLIVILAICGVVAFVLNRGVARPLTRLADVTRRLVQRDHSVEVPHVAQRNEVGEMARAIEVFRQSLIELDRTSVLRATADTLPAMVGYVDARRRIGFLNSEFSNWFDFGSEDVANLSGRPLVQVFPNNSFPGAQKELGAAFSGEEARFEHWIAPRGAAGREVEAYFRPHRSSEGRVLGVVTLLTDITERKRMERRLGQQARDLARSNEELEQFAYVASHDLKAPLRGIENLITWIEEDLEGKLEGDTQTNMDLVKNRVQRLETLLDDLLTYSRAGREDATLDTVDVGRLIEDLAVLVDPPDGFSIESEQSLPVLSTARAPLTQVFQNLIGNAIKHHDHPATGHIRVSAEQRGEFVEFRVTDDGPGVAPQFRERVFGMFQTLRPRDDVEGSGMGLAIVKKLVERYGARVWLADPASGSGLSVHFTWPSNLKEKDYGAHRQSAAGGR